MLIDKLRHCLFKDKDIEMYDFCKSTDRNIRKMQETMENVHKLVQENNYAAVFNSVTTSSTWLQNKNFAPGRWAVGYPFLYILYRTLNEVNPMCILELGLGQTTKMISQFVSATHDCKHFVVEHDPDWIDFCKRSMAFSQNTQIVQLPWDYVTYKGVKGVRCYNGFKEVFQNRKFDLICIDGPLGGDMNEYARIDILSILPQSLEKDFCIMIDDSMRIGETHSINDLYEVLNNNGINYSVGIYGGAKEMTVITSEKLHWLCTL